MFRSALVFFASLFLGSTALGVQFLNQTPTTYVLLSQANKGCTITIRAHQGHSVINAYQEEVRLKLAHDLYNKDPMQFKQQFEAMRASLAFQYGLYSTTVREFTYSDYLMWLIQSNNHWPVLNLYKLEFEISFDKQDEDPANIFSFSFPVVTDIQKPITLSESETPLVSKGQTRRDVLEGKDSLLISYANGTVYQTSAKRERQEGEEVLVTKNIALQVDKDIAQLKKASVTITYENLDDEVDVDSATRFYHRSCVASDLEAQAAFD